MEAQGEMTQAVENDGEATTSEDDQEPREEDPPEGAPRVEAQVEIPQGDDDDDEEDTTREDDQRPRLEDSSEAAPRMEAQGELPLCHQVEKTHKK